MPDLAPIHQDVPRWRIPLIGAATTLMVALVMGYWYWTSTPQYALLQAGKAFKSHDLDKFERYVSIDDCADSFTDEFFAQTMAESNGPTDPNEGEMAKAGREIADGFVSLLKPSVSEAVKTKVREFVSNGSASPLDADGSQSPVDLEALKNNVEGDNLQYEGVGNVDIDGSKAVVELRFHNEKQNNAQPVQLEMRRVGHHWQVSRWKNVSEWIKKANAWSDK